MCLKGRSAGRQAGVRVRTVSGDKISQFKRKKRKRGRSIDAGDLASQDSSRILSG